MVHELLGQTSQSCRYLYYVCEIVLQALPRLYGYQSRIVIDYPEKS